MRNLGPDSRRTPRNRANRWLTALALVLLAAALGVAQENGNALQTIERCLRAPEGLEVTLWAQSPLLSDPTSMDVDERGRLWVSEGVNYRRFNASKDKPSDRRRSDRIVILEDSDGDGRADRAKIFVEDPDLVCPLGVSVLGDKVVVSCSPDLIVYTRDQDDHVVRKEKLLSGWGGLNHDHGLHRFEAGPDGRWYGNAGNAGPHIVKDRSGWTLRAGSWYIGGSPYNTSNTPGLRSDDGRVYTGGVMVRVEPDGSHLRVVGHSFRNPYGVCTDSFGDVWTNDNDDTQSCRTMWLQRYGDCGYNSKDGSRSWQADRRPGQSIPAAHWRQDDPGVIPSGHVYGNGAPTGIAYYENGSLGPAWDGGLLLSCDAGQNVVWGYRRVPDGAGFKLEGFPFLTSTGVQDPDYKWSKKESDARKWFRPSAVTVGTDGCVYVADWFDPIVGGHRKEDALGIGAIYRIAPKGARPHPPALVCNTPEGAIAALKCPAPNVRHAGYQTLAGQGKRAEPALRQLLESGDRFLRARAIWLLARIGADVEDLLRDPDAEIRIVAFRALEQAKGTGLLPTAKILANDTSPAVRREVALVLRDFPPEERLPLLDSLAARAPAGDRWTLEALGSGAEGVEEALYALLLARSPGSPRQWPEAVAELAWRLHPKTAVPALRERAMESSLALPERRRAMDALAFIPDRSAALAMKDLAEEGPADLRSMASYWIQHRGTNDWKDYGIHLETRIGGITLPGEPRFASPLLRKGAVRVEVDLRGAKRLYLAVDDAGDGKACDWADWADPVLIRHDAQGVLQEVPLPDRARIQGVTGWGDIQTNRNCLGSPLRIDGRVYERGLGVHAPAVMVYDVDGFDALRAVAGVDDGDRVAGGALHASGRASVQFLVFHDGPSEMDRALALRTVMLDASRGARERADAATALSRSAEGGRLLVTLMMEGRLPEGLLGQVAEEIRRNPDLATRALAGRYFPKIAAGGVPLPPIDELLKIDGNVAAGRSVFRSTQASCTSCHRAEGEGRDVGPDLSRIGEKFDRRGLLDAILNPSAAILVGYETHLFALESGETLTGFLSAENADSVTVRTVDGPARIVPKKSILKRKQLDLSLMPDNVALGLTPQQLGDLAAYLKSLSRKD